LSSLGLEELMRVSQERRSSQLEARLTRKRKKCTRVKQDKVKSMLGEDANMGEVMALREIALIGMFYGIMVSKKSLY